MKRALRYLKFICLGLFSTLVLIFLVNQIPTEQDAAVEETIKNYQPELEKNALAENPLYIFLQQNEPSPELMAVYSLLISTTELPKIPPRMDVHKPIIAMFRWNKELLKYAETQNEREKLKIITGLVDISSKLLENRITIVEFKIFLATARLTLDWATAQKWSPKATDELKELSQKVSGLLDKREALVRNALNGERELSFQVILDTDLQNLEINNLGTKSLKPTPQSYLQTKILSQVGHLLFDRNQTLNIINARFDKLSASTVCLQDYSCDKLKAEPYDVSTLSMLRNPVGKGILKVLAFREHEMAKNQESFHKLEQSNKALSAIL